jgi:hypothetical protein
MEWHRMIYTVSCLARPLTQHILLLLLLLLCLCRCLQAAEKGEEGDGKKKWHEEKQKKRGEELARLGLTPEQAYRLESAEVAEAKAKKKVRRAWGLPGCGVYQTCAVTAVRPGADFF